MPIYYSPSVFHIHPFRTMYGMRVDIHFYLVQKQSQRILTMGQDGKVELVDLKDGQQEPMESQLVMTGQDVQVLVDQLYSLGFRPTEAMGSAGQLDAVNAHLQDMRKLVFERGKVLQQGVKNDSGG